MPLWAWPEEGQLSSPIGKKFYVGSQVILAANKLENYFSKTLQLFTFKNIICIYITGHVKQLAKPTVLKA